MKKGGITDEVSTAATALHFSTFLFIKLLKLLAKSISIRCSLPEGWKPSVSILVRKPNQNHKWCQPWVIHARLTHIHEPISCINSLQWQTTSFCRSRYRCRYALCLYRCLWCCDEKKVRYFRLKMKTLHRIGWDANFGRSKLGLTSHDIRMYHNN